jgi:hypothetical protein
VDDADELLGWPFRDPAWPTKLLLTGFVWFLLSLTVIGIPLAAINLNGWMLAAGDRYRAGKPELPPMGLYLARGWRLFLVQLVYLLALVVVSALPVAAGLRLGGVGGGLLSVFGESLLLVGSTALVAATPPLILLTESGGLRGGLDVGGLLRLLRQRGQESAASGLMSLLCLDIISPVGLLACGIGLVASTPYAYAVLAATAVAYDRKVRR